MFDELDRLGFHTRVVMTTSKDQARAMARRSVQAGDDLIVAAGGDGTVHGVLQEVAQTSTALAIAPIGSGNDIARALGIRGTPAELAKNPVLVDVAQIQETGVWFLSVLATGFDAVVNARANSMGSLRYIRALIREIPFLHSYAYAIDIDGVPKTGQAIMVCVGNTSTYGAGMQICPRAHAFDALLHVTWIHPVPRWRLITFFPQVFRGRHVVLPEVETYTGSTVTFMGQPRDIFADGESIGRLPCTVKVVPKALLLHAPGRVAV